MEVEKTFCLLWQHLAVQERVLSGAIKVMMLFTPVVFKVSLTGLPLPEFPPLPCTHHLGPARALSELAQGLNGP